MSSNAVTYSQCTTSWVTLARESLRVLEEWSRPYLLIISIRTPPRSSKMQCIRRMRMEIYFHSIFRLTTYSSLRLIFSPSIQSRKKLDSHSKSQWIWPSKFKLVLRRLPLSTRPCVFNKKLMACCNVSKFKPKFKTKKWTKISGNSRQRTRESAQLVSLLQTLAQRLKPIWSRRRQRSTRLNFWLIPRRLRRMRTLN